MSEHTNPVQALEEARRAATEAMAEAAALADFDESGGALVEARIHPDGRHAVRVDGDPWVVARHDLADMPHVVGDDWSGWSATGWRELLPDDPDVLRQWVEVLRERAGAQEAQQVRAAGEVVDAFLRRLDRGVPAEVALERVIRAAHLPPHRRSTDTETSPAQGPVPLAISRERLRAAVADAVADGSAPGGGGADGEVARLRVELAGLRYALAEHDRRDPDIAEAALGMFVEYRDVHSYDTGAARDQAVEEIRQASEATTALAGHDATDHHDAALAGGGADSVIPRWVRDAAADHTARIAGPASTDHQVGAGLSEQATNAALAPRRTGETNLELAAPPAPGNAAVAAALTATAAVRSPGHPAPPAAPTITGVPSAGPSPTGPRRHR